MRVYAIRDRLLEYFLQPFIAPDDKNVLAGVSETINQEDGRHAIQKAPHHFEIWRLAEINQETGKVTGEPTFIAECGGLVRIDFRETGERRRTAPNPPPGGLQRPAGGTAGRTDAEAGPVQDPAQAADREGGKAPAGHPDRPAGS